VREGSSSKDLAGARLRLVEAPGGALREAFAASVREGLTARPKRLECAWLYDDEGSRLFERICEIPEYYLTRAEDEILRDHAGEIVAGIDGGADLVELGSGSGSKTRRLIAARLRGRDRLRYVPIDISRGALEDAAVRLLGEFPALSIVAIAADYERGLEELRDLSLGPKLVLWLGSNIGNFDRDGASAFLARVGRVLTPDCRMVVGFDLRKDRRALELAYDDPAGVTSAFALNLLARTNRELGGEFDLSRFAHRARYDERDGRVDLFLESRIAQTVAIRDLGLEVELAEGEPIHVESSYKHSPEEIDELAARAGFEVERRWLDGERRFCDARLRLAT
jgi:L-histidine N-alpha-methyltransferase